MARTCVGRVPPVLSQTEKPSVKTFQRLLPKPRLTAAEKLRGLLISRLSEKHTIDASGD